MADTGKQAGVNFYVTLSTQLCTATLGIIAVWGAFLTYNLEKNEPGCAFFLTSMGAFVVFVVSMYMGGKGINALAKSAFNEDWSLKSGSDYFSWQTFYCLVGLALFIASIFLRGQPKIDLADAQETAALRAALVKSDSKLESTQGELIKLTAEIAKLEAKLTKHMQKTTAKECAAASLKDVKSDPATK